MPPSPPRRSAAVRPSDPFFDKPYEALVASAEATGLGADSNPSHGLWPGTPAPSRNIRPKRKVASLLGGGQ